MTDLRHDSPSQAIVALVALPGSQGTSIADAWSAGGVPVVAHGEHAPSISDEILAACQSNWWAPPEYLPDWEDEPEIAALAVRQWEAVSSQIEDSNALVWWDERHPLLIDLWLMPKRSVRAAVLLWDAPDQSVNALKGLGIGSIHAKALWEHALLHALASLAGQSVYVCDRRELNTGGNDAFRSFMATNGIDVSAAVTPQGSSALQQGGEGGFDRLLEVLNSVSGPHESFPELALPDLSATSSELLAAHRAAHRAGLEAREAWQLADRREREMARIQAELNHTTKGIDRVAEHLLNALGAP